VKAEKRPKNEKNKFISARRFIASLEPMQFCRFYDYLISQASLIRRSLPGPSIGGREVKARKTPFEKNVKKGRKAASMKSFFYYKILSLDIQKYFPQEF
jgi:hypothetical protein